MFNKISIRLRLTILAGILLTVCCIGLTIVLNFYAFHVMDNIEAAMITIPAMKFPVSQDSNINEEFDFFAPSAGLQNAKKTFGYHSFIYMIIVICGGSALTYFIAGKALNPLDILNGQVKNLNINNLAKPLDVPQTKDEIAQLTQSFNEMTTKLNDAFEMQKRFSASAAHELKTPLTVLQAKVDVFKKKETHTIDEYDALILVFNKQISRLRNLVGNLLDLSNMNDNSEQSNVCLKDIFEDITSELSFLAKDKNITLKLFCDDSIIKGNVDLLYRAFYNLIENGIKYNINGGTVEINVSKIRKKQIQILIRDSGIGIPDEMKSHIFEPFYRVDKSRSREMGGAGLGLALVDNIIKVHNGTISVFDNKNNGTCFKIVF